MWPVQPLAHRACCAPFITWTPPTNNQLSMSDCWLSCSAIGWHHSRPLPQAANCQWAAVSGPFSQPSVEWWSSGIEWSKRWILASPAALQFTWPRASGWAGRPREQTGGCFRQGSRALTNLLNLAQVLRQQRTSPLSPPMGPGGGLPPPRLRPPWVA